MSARATIVRAQQMVYDEMRTEFEAMGTGGPYCQTQKEYALKLVDEYDVRAVARIFGMPRRTLQRWCRAEHKYIQRCPGWVYSWATKRRR